MWMCRLYFIIIYCKINKQIINKRNLAGCFNFGNHPEKPFKRYRPLSASVCYSHSLTRKHNKYLGRRSGEACRPWRHLHLLAHHMAVWGPHPLPPAERFPTSEQLNNLVSHFTDKRPTDVLCICVYRCINTTAQRLSVVLSLNKLNANIKASHWLPGLSYLCESLKPFSRYRKSTSVFLRGRGEQFGDQH